MLGAGPHMFCSLVCQTRHLDTARHHLDTARHHLHLDTSDDPNTETPNYLMILTLEDTARLAFWRAPFRRTVSLFPTPSASLFFFSFSGPLP